MANEYRSSICLPNLRVLPTFLVDGFVAGTWSIRRSARGATLTVEPFDALSARVRRELTEEGNAVLRFREGDARAFEVRFGKRS